MKKIIFLFLIMCCFISMTACSKDEIIEQYNQALQALPHTGLTNNKELTKRTMKIFPAKRSFSEAPRLNGTAETK